MGPHAIESNAIGLPQTPPSSNGRKPRNLTKAASTSNITAPPKPPALTPLTSTMESSKAARDDDTSIKVIVRIRPFLPFEGQGKSVVMALENGKTIKMDTKNASHAVGRTQFTFDATYGIDSTQAQVFTKSIRPLVASCMEGYNATVLAYGQTGSGKTHSILGQTDQSDPNMDPGEDMSEAGVIPRALRALFMHLRNEKDGRMDSTHHRYDFNVKVQFLELYGEEVRDLLQPNPSGPEAPKLTIRDGRAGVEPEVVNIKEVHVATAEEALLCLTRGSLRRVTRATAMNSESSRSHAIMSVIITQTLTTLGEDGKTAKEITTKGSKLHFVDLAGSERIKKTGVTGQGLKEGVNINKGLLVLGNVISALASQTDPSKSGGFVPYRDSKLTRLLKGSLGGNHKTLMVACVSPSGSNTEETLNTLRYANRAKNIQNKAVVNMDAGSKMITELRDNIKAMAVDFLRVRSLCGDGVEIDKEDTVFTEAVLLALVGGTDVKIDLKKGKKAKLKAEEAPVSPEKQPVAGVVSSGPAAVPLPVRPKTANAGLAPVKEVVSLKQQEEVEKAMGETKRLRRALEKSDDRVIETERQLEWVREELRLSREEVTALAETSNDKNSDNDSESASGVSALTEDFEMPRLSQETYETVKSIYEEKLIQMTLELKEREDERENIAMTLYRHESDSQRLFYVKNTLTEDLARKEEQIAELKSELREVSQLTVIPNAAPQTERQFRRLRVRGAKRLAANASMSMSSYYTEKLNKIERHIKLREEECASLGQELEKLEADSQIFTDLAKDLSDRLKAKDKNIHKKTPELKEMTQQQLTRLNVVIEKDREEREQLEAELKRLKDDSETFSALVKALTDERKTKLEHVEKYKRRHRELAVSVGMTSPYVEGNDGVDDDDDASVSSTWSFMSIDSVTTTGTNQSIQSVGLGTITKIEYDQRLSTLEANITKHEEDRVFILNDLEKLEADTHAFAELSDSLKQKLKMKEEQIEKLRKDLDDFSERLQKQEKELAGLTNDDPDDGGVAGEVGDGAMPVKEEQEFEKDIVMDR